MIVTRNQSRKMHQATSVAESGSVSKSGLVSSNCTAALKPTAALKSITNKSTAALKSTTNLKTTAAMKSTLNTNSSATLKSVSALKSAPKKSTAALKSTPNKSSAASSSTVFKSTAGLMPTAAVDNQDDFVASERSISLKSIYVLLTNAFMAIQRIEDSQETTERDLDEWTGILADLVKRVDDMARAMENAKAANDQGDREGQEEFQNEVIILINDLDTSNVNLNVYWSLHRGQD
ncbi:hypothetical protein BJV82DRAFT_50541 [Fennellomyces sp. T-0311]|nr:hypothetical protein BJV82DRAFT_50541 [Fennellomyces sp. T-0311]